MDTKHLNKYKDFSEDYLRALKEIKETPKEYVYRVNKFTDSRFDEWCRE